MIHAAVAVFVNAPAETVRRVFADVGNWPRLFAGTIRGARVTRREGDALFVDVEHVEGRVVNVLRFPSPSRIELREFKRRYDATFVYDFLPAGEGTRYRLTAAVSVKWPYKIAEPFLKPLVVSRMRRHVVEPLVAAVERELRSNRQGGKDGLGHEL